MRLAKKFKFVHKDNKDGYLYTAEEDDTGEYILTWEWNDDDYCDDVDPILTYNRDNVERNIVNGLWLIREVLEVDKEEYVVPDVLNVTSKASNAKYTVIRQGDGTFHVFTETGKRTGMMFTYTEDDVRSYVESGTWVVKEVVELEVELEVEPEYLPPDDFQGLEHTHMWVDELQPDYGITLLDVRKFCEDTGYTVEVDEDHIAFIYDGSIEYVVSDENDMAAVMQAIRTLTKFSDRG